MKSLADLLLLKQIGYHALDHRSQSLLEMWTLLSDTTAVDQGWANTSPSQWAACNIRTL